MLVEDLIGKSATLGTREVHLIRQSCGQFIRESGGFPIYKNLPTSYNDFHKVKVRQHKRRDKVVEVFNKAFSAEQANLRQRAVYSYGAVPSIQEGMETFYVFPTDGYRFLYSTEVKNSGDNLRNVLDVLFEQLEQKEAVEVVVDLLKYTYSKTHLVEGILAKAEILFYGIPSYYAVRVSACKNYRDLLTS